MEPVLTTHEVAELLSVDRSTVGKWIDRNLLIAFRTPGGHRRVRKPDLVSFLEKHQMPIPEELGSPKVKLLVVDDDRLALASIRRAFKRFSAEVELTTVENGTEALLIAPELKPTGFLIDLNMPDVDGYEVCRAIRSRPSLAAIRMVTFTGQHTEEAVKRSFAAGAIACLAKPIDVSEVLELFRPPIALARRPS